MNPFLRPVTASEIDEAYALYREVFTWLNTKGVRQWLVPLPPEVFAERQRRGELLAHATDGRIAAIVTLAFEASESWTETLGLGNRWWIKSLAVGPRQRGARLGEHVMQACEIAVRQQRGIEVFLDCVDTGFLPAYYARLGYVALGRKDITYPSGNTFRVALMRKPASPPSLSPPSPSPSSAA